MRNRLVLAAFLLAGCTTTQPTVLPDGSPGFVISCGDNGIYVEGAGACMKKAGDACPHGYDVHNTTAESMLIRCKAQR